MNIDKEPNKTYNLRETPKRTEKGKLFDELTSRSKTGHDETDKKNDQTDRETGRSSRDAREENFVVTEEVGNMSTNPEPNYESENDERDLGITPLETNIFAQGDSPHNTNRVHTESDLECDTSNETKILMAMLQQMQTQIQTQNKQTQTQIRTQNEQIQTQIRTQNEQIQTQNKQIQNQIQTNHEEQCRELNEIRNEITNLRVEIEEEIDKRIADNNTKLVGIFDKKFDDQKQELKETVEGLTKNMLSKTNEVCQNLKKQLNSETLEIKRITQINRDQIDEIKEQTQNKIAEVTATITQNSNDLFKIKEDIIVIQEQHRDLGNQIERLGSGNERSIIGDVREIIITHANLEPNEKLPKFTGRERDPLNFLNRLKRYLEKTNMRKGQNQYTPTLEDIIENCLEDSASRWWQIVKSDIQNYSEFETIFLEKYWNMDIQRGIKRRIELERYRSGGKLNRAEYFIERAIILRNMKPLLEEAEIVALLSEQFEDRIQDARRVQNITTIRNFEQLLGREDVEEQNHRLRHRPNEYHRNQRNQNYNQNPNVKEPHDTSHHNINQYSRPDHNHQNINRPHFQNQQRTQHHQHQSYNNRHNFTTNPYNQQINDRRRDFTQTQNQRLQATRNQTDSKVEGGNSENR